MWIHGQTPKGPRAQGPNPQRSHRGCLWTGGAGHGLVLLPGGQNPIPIPGQMYRGQSVSPLLKGEAVEVQGMAPEESCASDMLVLIKWQGRTMAVPLSQLQAIKGNKATNEGIADWHYWVAQGYLF